MRMKKMQKLLAMLLCVVMCLSLFPLSAFAEEEAADAPEDVVVAAEEEPAEEPEPEVEEPAEVPAEEVAESAEEPAEVPAEPVEEVTEPSEEPAEEPAEPVVEPAEEEDAPIVTQSVAEPYEFVDEDGVVHGFSGSMPEVTVAGITDPDFPTVLAFSMKVQEWVEDEEAGTPGEWVDKDGDATEGDAMLLTALVKAPTPLNLDSCHLTIKCPDGSPLEPAMIKDEDDPVRDEFSATYLISWWWIFEDLDVNGTYTVSVAYFEDIFGLYTLYTGESLKTYFPGTVTLTEAYDPYPGSLPPTPAEDIVLKENGKTLQAGKGKLNLSFTMEKELDLENLIAAFSLKDNLKAEEGYIYVLGSTAGEVYDAEYDVTYQAVPGLVYDAKTGKVTTKNQAPLPDTLYEGVWFLASIGYVEKAAEGGTPALKSIYEDDGSQAISFTLSNAAAAPFITNVKNRDNVATIVETGHIILTFDVDVSSLMSDDPEAEVPTIESADMRLSLLKPANISGAEAGVKYGWEDVAKPSVSFETSELKDGVYNVTATLSFLSSEIYGLYSVDEVTADVSCDGQSFAVSAPAGIRFALQPRDPEAESPNSAARDYLNMYPDEPATITLFNYDAYYSQSYDPAKELFTFTRIDENTYMLQDETGAIIAIAPKDSQEPLENDVISFEPPSGPSDGQVTVTAKAPGTAYIVVKHKILTRVDNGKTGETTETYSEAFDRCRIDVVPYGDPEYTIKSVRLIDSKATVELYSTNYTHVGLLPEMGYLTGDLTTQDILEDAAFVPVPEDNSWTILSAKFTDPETDKLFGLNVVDDRTLAVVPRYEAMMAAQEKASNVKGSYKSAIEVTFTTKESDTEFNVQPPTTTAELALTVKKTIPSIKVSNISFNSALTILSEGAKDNQAFLTPTVDGKVRWEADHEAAAKAKKPAVPEFLEVDSASGMVKLKYLGADTPKTASGKLYLLATLEGWAIKKSVTVSYSVKYTEPTVKYSPATLTLNPDVHDEPETLVTVSPADFVVEEPFNNLYGPFGLTFSRVIIDKDEYKVDPTSGPEWTPYLTLFKYQDDDGNIHVGAGLVYDDATGKPVLDVSKAHTIKVYLQINGTELKTPFTVKTLKTGTLVTLSAKQTGAMKIYPELGEGGFEGKITIALTVKNYAGVLDDDTVNVIITDKKGNPVDSNVLDWDFSENATWTIKPGTDLNQADSPFTATFTLGEGEDAPSTDVKLKITFAKTPASFPIAVKMTGSIDPIRDASPKSNQIKFTVTALGQSLPLGILGEAGALEVLVDGEKVELNDPYFSTKFPFTIVTEDPDDNGNYETWISLNPNAVPEDTDVTKTKYSIKIASKIVPKAADPDSNELLPEFSAFKEYKLTIKKGSAKLTVSNATLYIGDRFSTDVVTLTPTDPNLNGFKVECTDAIFDVKQVDGTGGVTIGFKDGKTTGLKAGQTKTVKLAVTFDGNNTGKQDATVSVKVQIK